MFICWGWMKWNPFNCDCRIKNCFILWLPDFQMFLEKKILMFFTQDDINQTKLTIARIFEIHEILLFPVSAANLLCVVLHYVRYKYHCFYICSWKTILRANSGTLISIIKFSLLAKVSHRCVSWGLFFLFGIWIYTKFINELEE